VAASWLLGFVAFRSDRIQAARAKTIEDEAVREAELIRVVHVTMTSVRDIVGNCLTELQHLRMEAEGKVPEEALSIFDESIRRAMSRLSAIESLEAFAEKEMAIGLGLHIEDLPGKHRNGKA
jgi:predicted ATPase